jgi:hypothetical protein
MEERPAGGKPSDSVLIHLPEGSPGALGSCHQTQTAVLPVMTHCGYWDLELSAFIAASVPFCLPTVARDRNDALMPLGTIAVKRDMRALTALA